MSNLLGRIFLIGALCLMVLGVAKAMDPQVVKLHKEALYNVVLVDVGNGSGSGTVVYSQEVDGEWGTYILTNHHVVSSLIRVEEVWDGRVGKNIKVERRGRLEVRWFQYNDYSKAVGNTGRAAEIVAYDKAKDLALLRLVDHERGVDSVAALFPRDATAHLAEQVWAVGAGLGRPPYVSMGVINLLEVIKEGQPYVMTSTPIIWGNSGGALFRYSAERDRFELIGVPNQIEIQGIGWTPIVLNNMAFSVPMDTVYKFFDEQCYSPVVGQDFVEQCESLGKLKPPAKE